MRISVFKKCLSVFFIIITLLGMVGCGANTSTTTSEKNTPQQSNEGNTTPEATPVSFPEKGKQIRFIVPTSPGGGFDTQARMLAPYWEKHLGNGVTIIVENIAGGNYNMGVNEIWKANKDGYTVGIFPGTIANQVISDVEYDLNKFEWVGQITDSPFVFAVSKHSGFKSIDDVINANRKVVVGAAGLTAVSAIATMIAGDVFGYQQDIIAHKGSTEGTLAVVRGDADISYQSYESLSQFFESGDLIPLYVGSKERLPELPDVTSVTEIPQATDGLISLGTLPRIVATTPGTPAEVVEILRESFKEAVNDPEFVKQMEQNQSPAKYTSGDEVSQLVNDVISQYETYKDLITEYQ